MVQKSCTNEHVEPIIKERDDLNGEAPPEICPPAPDYPPELSESGVAIEAAQHVEEPLESGTQRQYSLDDFELIRYEF